MKGYTVKQLSKIAGVSVRTLHHYDAIGLLKPSVRTEARYRLYGNAELLRLQQVLFFKELDFKLSDIVEILDNPEFDNITALQNHKTAIQQRKTQLNSLLKTIDTTILKLKGEQKMLTHEELYSGFPKETAEEHRNEAIEKYGKETIEKSENSLRKLSKEELMAKKKESDEIVEAITSLMDCNPSDGVVQLQVALHYQNIKDMWGDGVPKEQQLVAYKGLATLYVEDKRFYADAKEGFSEFLSKAILHFVAHQ